MKQVNEQTIRAKMFLRLRTFFDRRKYHRELKAQTKFETVFRKFSGFQPDENIVDTIAK